MDRRKMLAGLGASLLMNAETARGTPSFLELRVWRMHNSAEDQTKRVSAYLAHGYAPALGRAGAKLAGAFSNVIGPEGPQFITLAQYASLAAFEQTLAKLPADAEHARALEELDEGRGVPFVRVDSSLLRSFSAMPEPEITAAAEPRIFELRCYESQSFRTLARKVGMFNDAEAGIFKRLGFRPVFFGETIAGAKQPNLMYMLSYENLAARDRLWHAFGSDPEWKKLSKQPGLSDAEIVANISNVILSALPFSAIR
ncbi:MAG TPA: NIPSNAP family protein [Bryobacteraceae bacterium]